MTIPARTILTRSATCMTGYTGCKFGSGWHSSFPYLQGTTWTCNSLYRKIMHAAVVPPDSLCSLVLDKWYAGHPRRWRWNLLNDLSVLPDWLSGTSCQTLLRSLTLLAFSSPNLKEPCLDSRTMSEHWQSAFVFNHVVYMALYKLSNYGNNNNKCNVKLSQANIWIFSWSRPLFDVTVYSFVKVDTLLP